MKSVFCFFKDQTGAYAEDPGCSPPRESIGDFRQRMSENKWREDQLHIQKQILDELVKIRKLQEENNALLKLRKTNGNCSHAVDVVSIPLVDLAVILTDPKYTNGKCRADPQDFITSLTIDLASRSVYGDDVLSDCNVIRETNDHKALDRHKLEKIKTAVRQKMVDDGVHLLTPLQFEERWKKALESLQTRCTNYRRGATKAATSSQIARMSMSNLY